MNTDIIIDGLQQVIIISAITEPVVEGVKLTILPRELTPAQKMSISFAVATGIAACTGVTLFEGGLASKVIGAVIAGFIGGRGSNITHSLIGVIRGLADQIKVKTIK